jgi:outer membrane receptor for ferrienterochelin and colicin
MSSNANRTSIICCCLAVIAIALLPQRLVAQAQAGTGQIVGTVYDASHLPVAEASVALNNKSTGFQREEKTNEEGEYRFALLPVGNYVLTFNHTGMKTYKVDVEVTVGAALTINANLQVGAVTQTVEVTATNLIESTTPAPDALIGVRAIEELPINGRRFQDFVTLTPTVQIEPQRNGISFAGQRGINGNVTIDGADYNEPFFGGIRGGERSNNAFTIPQEAISQFQVLASGYSVEFGRSTGGLLNATTKSGANDLHGSAFLFARNQSLAKQDAFQRDAITSLYQEGGSAGGRLIRDKAFFFLAFEDQKNDNPRVVVFHQLDTTGSSITFPLLPTQLEAACFYRNVSGCPSGTTGQDGPFTQTNDALTGFARTDFQLNQNHRVAGSYHYSKNTGNNAVSTGDAISPETSRAQSNNGTEGDRTNSVGGQWTAIWSPRLIQETRGQYSLENRPRLSNSTLTGISNKIGTIGARNFLPTTLDDWRTQLSSNATWTFRTHAFKFGGEYNFLRANQFFQFNQFGVFNVNNPPGGAMQINQILQLMSDNHLTTGGNNRFDSPLVTYSVNIGNGLLNADMKQVAFFLQDTWRFTPRLTLTAGFRWEGYVNPQPDVSNSTLYNQVKNFNFPLGLTVDPAKLPNNYDQYMPRLGLAWDPKGDTKTVIRANGGLFYAPTPLIILAAPLNNFRATPGDLSVQLPLSEASLPATAPCKSNPTIYCQLNLIGVDLNTFPLTGLPKVTPAQITAIATALGLPNPNPFKGSAPIAMANNYQSPRAWQWSLGVERELLPGWSVGADFNYVNTVHLERDRNLNLPAPVLCGTSPSAPPCKAGAAGVDLSLRPCFGISGRAAPCAQARPISTLGDITIRATDARSRYDGFTIRSNYRQKRFQFQAFYTLSYNYSDDDNERLASGFDHDNGFNLAPEYYFSRLDARHLLQYNTIVDLWKGFTVSSLGRFRSGRPLDPLTGSDSNGDNNIFSDRAYSAPGVSFKRNSFRDLRTYNVDMRVAKNFRIRERMSLNVTADFFNLFNFKNMVFISGTASPFNPLDVYGLGVNSAGAVVPANASFRQLTNSAFCSSTNPGCYNANATPGSPFTAQLGLRFQF